MYQQIANQEDLVTAESDEEYPDEEVVESEIPNVPPPRSPSEGAENAPPQLRSAGVSPDSTPVQLPVDADKENLLDDRTESLSEASGLSFFHEMTDQEIASKILTPRTIDRVRDRSRLRRLLQNQRPIAFDTGGMAGEHERQKREFERDLVANPSPRKPMAFSRSSRHGLHGAAKAHSDTSAEGYTSPRPLKAFTRAGPLNGTRTTELNDEDSDTPPELQERERLFAFSRASRLLGGKSKRIVAGTEQDSHDRPPKSAAFSRAQHLPPLYSGAHATENQEQQRDPGRWAPQSDVASVTSHRSEPTMNGPWPSGESVSAKDSMTKWRQRTVDDIKEKISRSPVEGSDEVDWAAAAANVPLPSIEDSATPQDTPKSAWPSSVQKQKSIDRIRRWDNDFTGLSFQVSESPPVRARPSAADYVRDREIENLAKQAVTTNRLGELREKEPQEKPGKAFGSRPGTSAGTHTENEAKTPIPQVNGVASVEQDQPDTPISVYKSASNESDHRSKSDSSNSTSAKEDSLDPLKRLARAMSTTPRSSPAPEAPPPEHGKPLHAGPSVSKAQEKGSPILQELPPGHEEHSQPSKPVQVAETPRVIGAWTDTILPDTTKTLKQRQKEPKYAETPHVSAGGWIDTPLPNGTRHGSVRAPMTIEEVTEELTNGIAAEKPVIQGPEPASEPATTSEARASERIPTPLEMVLSQAKQKRLVSQDTTDVRDDTLDMGDTTIQSMENLIGMDTTDLTALMHLSTERDALGDPGLMDEFHDHEMADEKFLERLSSRVERLRTNIHDARKGLSRLEHEFSQPAGTGRPQQAHALEIEQSGHCQACGRRGLDHGHDSPPGFPVTYSALTLPLPLLFSRRKDLGQRLPRPTLLGWVTILLWSWYLAESTMCELYCHPLYAERYVWPARPEPVFPYVLPTMLWRWSQMDQIGPAVLGPLWTLVVALCRMVGMWLGLTDGFVDEPTGRGRSLFTAATKTALKVAQSVIPGSDGEGSDLSMMNDELI